MPAVSQRQFRLMQAVAHGSVKLPGLSAAQAAEYVAGQSPKGLPEKVNSHRKRALAHKIKQRKRNG